MPIPAGPDQVLHLDAGGGLGPAVTAGGEIRLVHRPTIGTRSSLSWGAGWQPNGLARDLRPDEALLPTWTSEPLVEPLHVFGRARARLAIAAAMPVATVVVRLSDIGPDGAVAQVSAGILNLTHVRGHDRPEPLEPGRAVEAEVPLRATGYRFAPGHRIRLSVASAYWPVIWPSPFPGELTIDLERSSLALPTIPAEASRPTPALRTEPPGLPDVGATPSDESATWQIAEDVLAGTVTVTTGSGEAVTLPDGTRLYSSELLEMTASDADPAHARMRTEVVYRLDQDGRAIVALANGLLTSGETTFELAIDLDVTLDGVPFHHGHWAETIPRRLV